MHIIFSANNNDDFQLIVNNFFLQFTNWCILNYSVINHVKSEFILFNLADVTVSINGRMLQP